jgi:hypothetical protein
MELESCFLRLTARSVTLGLRYIHHTKVPVHEEQLLEVVSDPEVPVCVTQIT